MRTQLIFLVLAAAQPVSAFLMPGRPAPVRTQGCVQMSAATAYTTIKGRILEDPKGELEKVLTPSPKDEARRERLQKVLEVAGLQWQGPAMFPSYRYYKTHAYADMLDAVGAQREDQLGVAALVVALADKGYKPFHKSATVYMDIMHSFVKAMLMEIDDFEAADLVKVFAGLVKLGYEGSPKQLIREYTRALAKRMEDGELEAKDLAVALDASSRYWFVPEDGFYSALAAQAVAKASDFSEQDKARVKDAWSRTSSRHAYLTAENVVPQEFVSTFA